MPRDMNHIILVCETRKTAYRVKWLVGRWKGLNILNMPDALNTRRTELRKVQLRF